MPEFVSVETSQEHRMISKQQLVEFDQQGFIVVENVLDPVDDLRPIIDDYSVLLDGLAHRWCREGRIRSPFSELPFVRRLTQIMCESSINVSRYFDISLPDSAVDYDEPIHLSEPVFKLITNPKLLDVVESFVGSEILSNPVQHVRIKPPESQVEGKFEQNFLVRRTGWHQDQGVIRSEADATNMLTVWLPVMDATIENGCLCVVPGSHRTGLSPHCPGADGLTIPDRLLGAKPLPVPIKAGSILCMHRLTKHSSLSNHSDVVRWSFDLRYQPVGQPTGREEYPAFVVRSQECPNAVIGDHRLWAKLWADARQKLAASSRQKKHRWPDDAPICA